MIETLPITPSDPINAAILAVSEDRLSGAEGAAHVDACPPAPDPGGDAAEKHLVRKRPQRSKRSTLGAQHEAAGPKADAPERGAGVLFVHDVAHPRSVRSRSQLSAESRHNVSSQTLARRRAATHTLARPAAVHAFPTSSPAPR